MPQRKPSITIAILWQRNKGCRNFVAMKQRLCAIVLALNKLKFVLLLDSLIVQVSKSTLEYKNRSHQLKSEDKPSHAPTLSNDVRYFCLNPK